MPGFAYNKKKTDLYADVPKDVKQDFTELIDNTIAQARDTALQGGDLRQGLEALFGVEKQTRQAVDISGTEKVALAIVELCKDAGNWNTLNESLTIIVKRRGQIKQVVTAIVQRGMEFLDDTPNEDTKVGLIETLREVSEGKMHTELERARLTRMLADIKEKNGSIIEAAELMQDLQVETYGSMSKEEKVPQYKTIKRLQKNYLIRCNDSLSNIIPGSGVKPASAIRRTERKIEKLRAELQGLNAEDMLSGTTHTRKPKNVQELNAKRTELGEEIKKLEDELVSFEIL